MKVFFNDPFTPFGKWLSQPFYVHGLTFLLLLSAVIFRPVLDYIEASTRFDETEYELAKKKFGIVASTENFNLFTTAVGKSKTFSRTGCTNYSFE